MTLQSNFSKFPLSTIIHHRAKITSRSHLPIAFLPLLLRLLQSITVHRSGAYVSLTTKRCNVNHVSRHRRPALVTVPTAISKLAQLHSPRCVLRHCQLIEYLLHSECIIDQ